MFRAIAGFEARANLKLGMFRRKRRSVMLPYILSAPLLLMIVFVFLMPLGMGVAMGFLNEKGSFVGFTNYAALISNRYFVHSLILTLIYVCLYTMGVFAVGFFTSLLLWHAERTRLKGSSLLKTLITLPYAIPDVVAALIWTLLLDPQLGLINYLFELVSFGHFSPQRWLQDPSLALYSVILVTIWRLFPLHTLILLGAYRTIPAEIIESAALDGAGPSAKFFRIILPMISDIVWSLLLLTVVWSFNRFTMLWLLTQGGPARASEITVLFVYREAFVFLKKNLAAAGGTILAGIVCTVVILYFGFQSWRRRVGAI